MKKIKIISTAIALAMITSMSSLASFSYSKGDANNDGKVNVRDCAYIANKLAAGKASSLPSEADYNSDGKINVRDAANLASDLAKGKVISPIVTPSTSFEYKGSLPTDGDKMTVLCWTDEDLSVMLDTWSKAENIDPSKINFKNFQTGGGEASAQYDQYFLSGEDVDMFMVEPDWALKYINDDSTTAPLSALGFTANDFSDNYDYTLELGKSTVNGDLKAVSYNPSPGGWCYRTDLAKKYLGVNTPEEMQTMVSDWDKFQSTAQKVSISSNGKTALTTTLSGVWQAFSGSRTTPWVKNNKLNVDSFCNEFISLAKNMKSNNYVTDYYSWSSDWWSVGQTDETMGYFVSTWGFGDSILETAAGGIGGKTYGKWNVCQGPTPYFWGGTWICASPKTDNADMVASFIDYFTINKDTMKYYFTEKNAKSSYNEFVNSQTIMQEIAEKEEYKNPVLGGQSEIFVLHEVAKNINIKNTITTYDSDINIAFLNAVNKYCSGSITNEKECIEEFKKNVLEYYPAIQTN